MMTEELWIIQNAMQELCIVKELLGQMNEKLQQALRLPLTKSFHGIITRQGPHVACIAKMQNTPIKLEQSIPQISIALDNIARAERELEPLENGADLSAVQEATLACKRLLSDSCLVLSAPLSGTVFPEKIRPIAQGLAAEVFVADSELVLQVHQYQDSQSGHKSLGTVKYAAADPGLIAFVAQIEAGLQRIKHISRNLEACSDGAIN